MRICQISKADAFGGGASRIAEELTGVLRARGHDAVHLVAQSRKPFDEARRPLYGRFTGRIHAAHRRLRGRILPDVVPLELVPALLEHRVLDYDILHFHDLSSAISPITVYALAKVRPVVWTFHDCSPFTGGCLYPMDCKRYRTGCGSCPQLGTWPLDAPVDLTRATRKMKAWVHRAGIHPLSPSAWMADLALTSGIVPIRPTVIANGIDTDLFRLRDRAAIRRALGIPSDRRVVLISAGLLSDGRKGIGLAIRALRAVSELRPFAIVVGAADAELAQDLDGLDHHLTGYVEDASRLAEHYAAADVMLSSSLADNQPLAILEAMASGTPVVGFGIGGIPELVRHDESGWLVSRTDEHGLAEGLRSTFEGNRWRRWIDNARAHVERSHSLERMGDEHRRFYERTVSRGHDRPS